LLRQEILKGKFEKLHSEGPPEGVRKFDPETLAMMEKVFKDPPATAISRGVGNLISDKMVAAGAGLAGGGTMATLGMLGGGSLLKRVSAGGTDEAVADLRRAMLGRKKYQGMLSPEKAAALTRGMRQIGMDEYLYPTEEY
jgi:hypothetical protein